jgi:hypothetical protein
MYGEEMSNWPGQPLSHNMQQGRIVSDRGNVNYESNRLENSNINNVNTSEGFNNLNVSFSIMGSYFEV